MNLLRSGILGGGGGAGCGSHMQGALGGAGVRMFKGLGFTCSGGAGGLHVEYSGRCVHVMDYEGCEGIK